MSDVVYMRAKQQEVLKTLKQHGWGRKGSAVALVKQHHPGAQQSIRIETLSGEEVGYIPHYVAGQLMFDISFGEIWYIDYNRFAGQWNEEATVGACLGVPPLALQLLPTALNAYQDNPAAALGAEVWRRLEAAALGRCFGRCEVTGVAAADLHVVPVWRVLPHNATVQLVGSLAVCEPVWWALQVHKFGKEAQAPLLEVFAIVNHWTLEECQIYIEHAQRLQRRMDEIEGWRVDVSSVVE